MKLGKTLFFGSLICLAIAACQKNGTSQSDEAILTTGKWQVSDATVTIPGTALIIDVYDSIPSCIRDNFYAFAADSTVTIDEGATKCNSASPQTVTGNWKLLNNNTQLQTIDPISGANANLTLVEINSNDMKVQDTTTYNYGGLNVNVTATVTFKHIN